MMKGGILCMCVYMCMYLCIGRERRLLEVRCCVLRWWFIHDGWRPEQTPNIKTPNPHTIKQSRNITRLAQTFLKKKYLNRSNTKWNTTQTMTTVLTSQMWERFVEERLADPDHPHIKVNNDKHSKHSNTQTRHSN
jgi:hypothetical protein